MYDFAKFTDAELKECGTALQALGSGASSMEEAANKIVRYLYDNITDPATGRKSCALVRFYKTHPYNQLDTELQTFAQGILGSVPASGDINCLTMLATVGGQDQWNSRAQSNGHRAIPLANAEMVASIPMIARLIN